MKLTRLGERARLVELTPTWSSPTERARHTLAAARAVARRWPALDVLPAAGVLLLADLDRLAAPTDGSSPDEALAASLAEVLAASLAPWFAAGPGEATSGANALPPEPAPVVVVPTVYDGADLAGVARLLGGAPSDVVNLHTSVDYTVELLGFLPGFAYLGPVAPELALPRRASPRPVVPARSVAVAAGFCGIYPAASPGGWHLLGRAPGFAPFSPHDGRPGLQPGGTVRFVAIGASDVPPAPPASERPGAPTGERSGGPTSADGRPALLVRRAPPGASVQDAGRRGQLSRGLPPSGPLDEALAAAANAAAGNDPAEAAIEVPLGPLEVEARGVVWVSVDGAPPRRLSDGERLTVTPRERPVAYLAVAGGVDTAVVQGSRSVLVAASLGGRALRRGDAVPVGDRTARAEQAAPPTRPALTPPPGPAWLLFVPGPHLDRLAPGALARLVATEFTVSRLGNRVGVRLEGAALPVGSGRLDLPWPMVRGAIEVTPDGTPIVLGPDHPVTGGYPVIGVLTRSAQGKLARLWPGHRVRLVSVG